LKNKQVIEMEIIQPDFSKIQWDQLPQKRREYVRDHSWAIPTLEAIRVIRKYAPIIEVGAGGGYWSHLISLDGTTTVTLDNQTNTYQKTWRSSQRGGAELLHLYSDHSLFLCWPPHDSSMASDCLLAFKGKYLIYIGEDQDGCTADDQFFSILKESFLEIEIVRIPTWPNIHDQLRIFKRVG
jgi:hypothetical protein